MGTRHSVSAKKRWQRRSERLAMSRRQKLVHRTKLKIGVPPKRQAPRSVQTFIDLATNECAEAVGYEPRHVGRDYCWAVTFIEGSVEGLTTRYSAYAQACGLDLYHLYKKPLRSGDGVSVVTFVGSPKGVS
jgi:hypothetical protein